MQPENGYTFKYRQTNRTKKVFADNNKMNIVVKLIRVLSPWDMSVPGKQTKTRLSTRRSNLIGKQKIKTRVYSVTPNKLDGSGV